MLQSVVRSVRRTLQTKEFDVHAYAPLVRRLAFKFSKISNLDYAELYNTGYEYLLKIGRGISYNMTPKAISSFIRQSIVGRLKNYITWNNNIIRNPNNSNKDFVKGQTSYAGLLDEFRFYDQEPNNEQKFIDAEGRAKLEDKLDRLIQQLNLRQRLTLKNMIEGRPLDQRQMAKRFKISQQAISKMEKKILKLAKEIE
jgi:RNA polymerase sigma factor (sigma-70 family)